MKKSKKILLEIGPGFTPVALKHKAKQRVMVDRIRFPKNYEEQKASQETGRTAEMVLGDIKQLPFRNEAFSRVEARMMNELYGRKYEEVIRNIREVRRVMKKGGVITISAENPYCDNIEKSFTNEGFVLIRQQKLEGKFHDTAWERAASFWKEMRPGKRFWFKKL